MMDDDFPVEFVAGSLTAIVLARAFERLPNPERGPDPLDDERGLNPSESVRLANLEKGSQILVDRYKRILMYDIGRFRPWFCGRQILPESFLPNSHSKLGTNARTAHEQVIKAASTVVHLKNHPPKSRLSWFKIGPLKDWKFDGLSEEIRQELLSWLRKTYSSQKAQTLIDRAEVHAGIPFKVHRVELVVRQTASQRPDNAPQALDPERLEAVKKAIAKKGEKAKREILLEYIREELDMSFPSDLFTPYLDHCREIGIFQGPTRCRKPSSS